MDSILNVTPNKAEDIKDSVKKDAEGIAKDTEGAAKVKGEGKPSIPPRSKPAPRQAPQKEEVDNSKWIRLERGGTYGYKRVIYQQGKVYEVDLATAEHLLAQHYILGNGNDTIEVHYFTEVAKRK